MESNIVGTVETHKGYSHKGYYYIIYIYIIYIYSWYDLTSVVHVKRLLRWEAVQEAQKAMGEARIFLNAKQAAARQGVAGVGGVGAGFTLRAARCSFAHAMAPACNVTPFGMTQAEALKMDPNLTATSFGYIPARNTVPEAPIPGLTYLREFITKEEEEALLSEVEAGPWDEENKSRRTKQYGYTFHWRNRRLNALRSAEKGMPSSSEATLKRLKELGLIPSAHFDQCIVNDYRGAQGIRPHRDREFFGPLVVGISLLEPVIMDFRCLRSREVRALLLEPRSVLLLTGEARWQWQHGITAAPKLLYQGKVLLRQRRTSLTFRTILDDSVVDIG